MHPCVLKENPVVVECLARHACRRGQTISIPGGYAAHHDDSGENYDTSVEA